ncbi:MAG TPA: hypothetical protein VG368_07640 [Acidimicrobiales bacterium]|nr:hypothetical protein [Acidimicrobiales bacterium]
MATYEFLSPEWIEAAHAERARHDQIDSPFSLAMNLVVGDVPFGDGRVEAHVSTEGGFIEIDLGLLDAPEVSVALDYGTAKAVLVDRDGEAAMAAFMAGKVRVEGDMAKLLAFGSRPLSDPERLLALEIRELTEP